MLFWTLEKKYSNIKLIDKSGKDICQFKNNKLETDNKKIISICKMKDKYPWIFWEEEKQKDENLRN